MPLTGPALIDLGFVGAYLIPTSDGGCVLVDSGVPKQEKKILAAMASQGFAPDALRLIIITHAHGDHMGSLSALVTATGAPVLAHRLDTASLESGKTLHPRGLTFPGTVLAPLMGGFVRAASRLACKVNYVVDDERSLADFGVAGRAMHTPGHTSGSVSVLLDSGDAIVGDLCAKLPLVNNASYVPTFGEDLSAVYESWRKLLDAGARRFFAAHARKPLPADALAAELARVGV